MNDEQTRAAVLNALRSRPGEYLSGEELARSLGLSRTAVWKHIDALRQQGYAVEAVPRLGYRLAAIPDLVTPDEVFRGLDTRVLGRWIEYRESVGSTNELAKQLARQGAPEGLVVLANEQTAGKGRLGRGWASPPGVGIWMSVVLRPEIPPYETPRLTLAAAVAVAHAIRQVAGVEAGIKWPNDIVHGGRKLCGILTELEAEWERVAFAVVGIGINVNTAPEQFPAELQPAASSLAIAGGRPVRRAPLVQAILTELETQYDRLRGGRFEQVLTDWRRLSVTLGQRVRVLPFADGELPLAGMAEDVDRDGALLVRLPTGELRRVLAGEVSLRPL